MFTVASALSAQNRLRATSAAPFLKEPGGLRLGTLVSGVTYPGGKNNQGHAEIIIEGWIPVASTAATQRDGFDLSLVAGGGAAVRATPGGNVIARITEGTLLGKSGSRGTWVKIRRSGWVARGSLAANTEVAAVAPPVTKPPSSRPRPPAPTSPIGRPSVPIADSTITRPSAQPAAAARRDSAARSDAPPTGLVSDQATLRKGAVLTTAPDGRRIAAVTETADVQVVDRRQGWAKIRIDAWVHEGDIAAEVNAGPRITAAMLRQQPEKYVGQPVTWRVQYLAMQEADDLRPEMPRGQNYVLARGPLPESGFVYLMLTKDQAADFRSRAPLDEVTIEAIIRAGRTKYLPTPVLSLVAVKEQK